MALEARGFWLDRNDAAHPWGRGTGRTGRRHGKRAAIRKAARRGRAKGESVKQYALRHGYAKRNGAWVQAGGGPA